MLLVSVFSGYYVFLHGKRTYRFRKHRAEPVYEKHCVLKNRLVSLGADPEIADRDACGIEHIISRESFEKIKNLCI